MKKQNININRPNWQHVIDNLNMSDYKIAVALGKSNVDYSPQAVGNLRNGVIAQPSYLVGRELLNMLGEQHAATTGRKPAVLKESRTR